MDSEQVNWTALQAVLTSGTESDVLIIADCCHSGSPGCPTKIRPYGVVELLAACGFESLTPVSGEHCFTRNLVEQLKNDHGTDPKTSKLHADLQYRLSSYSPSDFEQRVSAILCRLVDVQDDYSIRLIHLPKRKPAGSKSRRATPLLAKSTRRRSTLGSGRGPYMRIGSPTQSTIEPPGVDPSPHVSEDEVRSGPIQSAIEPPVIDPSSQVSEDQVKSGPSQSMIEPPEAQLSQPVLEDQVGMLLHALAFGSISDRRWQIPNSHRETFGWIFLENHPSRFAEWLSGDGEFYWISGNAGSGKSTLVKAIVESPETRRCLAVWAGKWPLDIVSYFFWNSGTVLQRSLQGLLQSIICQLLLIRPELAPQLGSQLGYVHQPGAGPWSPTRANLYIAFEFLLRSYDDSRRLCIFIDGLDECDDNHWELSRMIVSLAQRSGVKICASSRGWSVFADSFAYYPHLRVHELTGNDIETYVRSKLASEKEFATLESCYPDAASRLVSEVVTRSSGVFIWVYLTVESICRGLKGGDIVDDLFRRLESLPTDLELLYQRQLDNVDPVYRASALTILRLFIASQVQVISPTSQIPASEPLLTNVGLFIAEEAQLDRELVFQESIEPWNERYVMHMEEVSRRRIESRTGGMLSVEPRRAPKGGIQQSPGQLISYLHQTARIFIEQYVKRLGATMSDDFDPELLLLESSVIRLKGLDMGRPLTSMEEEVFHLECWALVDQAMVWASRVQPRNADRMARVLCELDRAMTVQFERWSGVASQGHWSRFLPLGLAKDEDWKDNFLSLAISYGVFHFIEKQVGQLGAVDAKEGRPLLDYALLPSFTASVNPQTVHLLIAAGADPNDVFCGVTVLDRFRDAVSKRADGPSIVQAGELASLRDLVEFLENVSQEKPARSGWKWLSQGLLCCRPRR